MAEVAVDAEAGGELDEAGGVGRALLPADEQVAEAVAPAVRDLHHPAARRVAVGGPGGGNGWVALRRGGICGA